MQNHRNFCHKKILTGLLSTGLDNSKITKIIMMMNHENQFKVQKFLTMEIWNYTVLMYITGAAYIIKY